MIRNPRLVFALFALTIVARLGAQTPEIGKPLPPWSEGMLDLHQISTGRGNAAFYRFPDGTTMLVDAGSANDRMPMADTEQRPDASRSVGEWIAHYIERGMVPTAARLDYALITHYHADHMGQLTAASKSSKSGAYKLTGITDVGASIPIALLIDRGTSYLVADDAMMKNYRAFVAEESKERGLRNEAFKPGSASQITLRKDAANYPSFEVRNVVANGRPPLRR